MVLCTAGGNEPQWHSSPAGQQIAGWILQQYATLGFRRTLTQADVAALEGRARAGSASSALEPRSWEDFQIWFSKTINALKQVCCATLVLFFCIALHIATGLQLCSDETLSYFNTQACLPCRLDTLLRHCSTHCKCLLTMQ